VGKISVLFGGRASEEVFFGNVSTGAQNDLEKATDIARKMVTTYGMSERISLTTLEKPANLFLAQEQQIDFNKKYSTETAKIIDEEVKKILSDNYEKVKGIIEDTER